MPGASDAVIILGLLAAAVLLALVLVAALWRMDHRALQGRLETLLSGRDRDLAEARRDSVQRSRSSLKGQIAEQLAPLLPGFPYRPSDARFIGDPIDYLVFDGYTAARDGSGNGGPAADGLDVVLLEVKQGGSALSPFQRLIAGAVQEGRVRFEIVRISEDGQLSTESWHPRRGADRGASR